MQKNRVIVYTEDCEGILTNPDNLVSIVQVPPYYVTLPGTPKPGNWVYKDGQFLSTDRPIFINGNKYSFPVTSLRVKCIRLFHITIILCIGLYVLWKSKRNKCT